MRPNPRTTRGLAVLPCLGLALVVLLGGCASTTARDAYLALPTDVPATFVGEPSEGARYCLVHLRQRHLPTYLGAGADPVAARAWVVRVNDHQREVYGILSEFADAGLDALLAEGVYTEDPWDSRESVEVEYVERLRAIDRVLSASDRSYEDAYRRLRETPGGPFLEDAEIVLLPSGAQREDARRVAEVMYASGAEYLLALERRLRVLPAERWELIARATRAYESAPPRSSRLAIADPALFDDREDAVLALLAAGRQPLAVVLFGGLHDFSDNVAAWNARHSEARIDLVVVTPDSYW